MSPQALAIFTFLHDLFSATWIGGMIAVGLSFHPAAVQVLGQSPQTKKLISTMQKRQSVLAYISMAGAALTGPPLAKQSAAFSGMFHWNNAYTSMVSTKAVLVLIMIAIALTRTLVLGKGQPTPQRSKLSVQLLYLNIALALIVLLLSSFGAMLA